MVRVLIADDDSATRELLSEVLRQAGYEVVAAADGDEALCLLRTSPFQMVAVLDVSMPKLLGTEVLQKRLQDQPVPWHHGYVLMSGLSLTSKQSLRPNLLAHLPVPIVMLSKPFGEDDLKRAIDQVARQIDLSGATPLETPAL